VHLILYNHSYAGSIMAFWLRPTEMCYGRI